MKNNNSLASINTLLSKIFIWIFIIALIMNIIGIFYQGKRTSDFMERNPDGGNYMALFFTIYLFLEMYILVILILTYALKSMKNPQWGKSILLFIIFIIGILPSIYFAISIFFKK